MLTTKCSKMSMESVIDFVNIDGVSVQKSYILFLFDEL